MRGTRHQAWAGLLLALVLAGCEVPKQVNPIEIYRAVSGDADAGRLPPPGMDLPRPNLASVPPRPERPPPEVRDAISAALAMDRGQSRSPLAPRATPAPAAAGAAPGALPMPPAPPPRPALANAPAIPWAGAPLRAAPAAPGRAPTAVPQPEPVAPPDIPDFAPAPPPPDLLGQPRRP